MKNNYETLIRVSTILSTVFLLLIKMPASANGDTPLDFAFIKSPPGKLISIGSHRLHVTCEGEGNITVLFEAGLGGSSMEWHPIQKRLPSGIMSCAYDRAGYAWSDRSPFPRSARQLAREANHLLNKLEVSGPVILVGHSFGGFVMRLLADIRDGDIIGLVLVDSSHEDQIREYEQLGGASPMPGSNKQFVIKNTGVPDNLPEDIRRKIEALGRMRKTYNATHAEMGEFRESARQITQRRHEFDFPVVVIPRGLDPLKDDVKGNTKAKIWLKLQQDLTRLSADSQLVTATHSGHHVHIDEPELVLNAITSIATSHK